MRFPDRSAPRWLVALVAAVTLCVVTFPAGTAHAAPPSRAFADIFSAPPLAAADADDESDDSEDDEDDYVYDDEEDEDNSGDDSSSDVDPDSDDTADSDDDEMSDEEYASYDVGDWGDPVESANRLWTVLVYLAADNDLEEMAILDFLEMQAGMADIDPETVEVVVLFDRAKGYDDSNGDWTDTRVYRILPSTGDEMASELVHECGELNTGGFLTLDNFIAEGMRVFPAPRTALFLWNHGGGWSGSLVDDDPPAAERDSTFMTLDEMRFALSHAAVHFPDGKLDLVLMDMCLMGQAETLVAFAPFVRYLVAGAPVVPGIGLNYRAAVAAFAGGGETLAIARDVVAASSRAYLDVGWRNASLSVYDLSRVGGLLSSFGALARKFDTLVPLAWPHLTRSIFYSRNYGGIEDLSARAGTVSSIDIVDWLDRLQAISDPSLAREFAAEIEAVRRAVAEVVVYVENGPSLTGANGLAVYAPLREDNYDDDYRVNAFGVYTNWAEALTDLHVEQRDNAGSPPRVLSIEFGSLPEDADAPDIEPADAVKMGEYGVDGDARFVKMTVNGTNIMWVTVGFALADSDDPDGKYTAAFRHTVLNSHIVVPADASAAVASVDGEIPVFRDGRNVFVLQFAPFLTALANGDDAVMVFPRHLEPGDLSSGRIFGELLREGRDEWVFAEIRTEGDEIVSVLTWQEEGSESFLTSVRPGPTDRFRPTYRAYTPEGDEILEKGEELVWGDEQRLMRFWPDEGRYIRLMCMAESLAGEGTLELGDPIWVEASPGGTEFRLWGDEDDEEEE